MFCPKCGKTINDGDMFCANCGFRTDTLFQQQGQPQNNIQNVPINYQPQNTQQYSPAEEKGHPVAIFFTTMIIGCGLLSGAIYLINPGQVLKNNEVAAVPPDSTVTAGAGNESSKAEAKKIVAVTTLAEDDRGESTTTVTTTRGPEDSSESSGLLKLPKRSKKTTTVTTTVTAETEAPQTSTAVTEPRSEAELKIIEARQAEAQRFSTNEKPEFSDFEWCYGQNGLITEQPSNGKNLPKSDQWIGGWKGFIAKSPTSADSKYIREVNNVDINIVEEKVTLTIRHHLYEIEGEVSDDSVTADFVFKGDVQDKGIDVSGTQHIYIKSFWKADGHEYAVGELTDTDGTEAYIALMR
jgi:hypothetical protein